MDREAFEQLVSAWLDEPERADWRAQIESAAAADPELARLRDQYVRLQGLIRTPVAEILPVAWETAKARISAAIDRSAAEDAEARLDEQLRALPGIEERVDWAAFGQRIASSIDQQTAAQRRLRMPIWRISIAAGAVAVAAGLVGLMMTHPWNPSARSTLPQSFAVARVVSATKPGAGDHSRPTVARVRIIEEPNSPANGTAVPSSPESSPEEYFMLEPPAVLAMASVSTFGSH